LSCNYYAMYSHVETLYGKEEAALQSHFEKLNFDAVRELIQREGIDCEFKWDNRRGGWDIYLTDEDFEWAKRELEAMRDAGGYTSSCRVFQGEEASKVPCLNLFQFEIWRRSADLKGCGGQVLCGWHSDTGACIVTAICSCHGVAAYPRATAFTSITHQHSCYIVDFPLDERETLYSSYAARGRQSTTCR